MEALKSKARNFYKGMQAKYAAQPGYRNPLIGPLEEYGRAHPGLGAFQLKAAQYRILAENLTPVVFDESPFYFVTDLDPGFQTGHPAWAAGGWLYNRNRHLFRDADPGTYDKFTRQIGLLVHLCCGDYADAQHFCYPSNRVVQFGLKGAYGRVQEAKSGAGPEELEFLQCAEAGLLAAKRIAERFAEAAELRKAEISDPALLKNMDMLIHAARNAPWNPARSLLEGLNALWFCRDVLGPLEGIGSSSLGRPDLLLCPLYERDIAEGALTRGEAYELVKQFVAMGDMHYDKDEAVSGASDQELEMGYVLGGCDGAGAPVWNELTRMFMRAHRELKAIYPKPHCRIGTGSPREYLLEIAGDFVSGRSVSGLSNDDGYIPALLRDGKTLEHAREYVNTGCWSSIVEGRESCPGGNYFYLITVLEQSVYGPEPEYAEAGARCDPLEGGRDFEEVYRIFAGNCARLMRWRCEAIGKYGPVAARVNPIPLSSALMDGCIESRRDFTQGGCRYNPNTVDPTGFANAVDALLAIKTICFDRRMATLGEFLGAVRNNWEGAGELLSAARHCPHFGDESAASAELSQRLYNDLYESVRGIKNERGGDFSLSYIVYREYMLKCKQIRATPDGRRDGDVFAQGISPTRFHPADPPTAVIQCVGALEPSKAGVTSLDLQLPAGRMDAEKLASFLHAATHTGVKHLQLNCVSVDELRDAQERPEKYPDLVVRVVGFSAKFVSLSREFQDEFIGRTLYGAA